MSGVFGRESSRWGGVTQDVLATLPNPDLGLDERLAAFSLYYKAYRQSRWLRF